MKNFMPYGFKKLGVCLGVAVSQKMSKNFPRNRRRNGNMQMSFLAKK